MFFINFAEEPVINEVVSCGKPLPRWKEKGHREREYCSDVCRKRASRERNKGKHDLDHIMKDAFERQWNAIAQDVHRESWQDDLEHKEQQVTLLLGMLKKARNEHEYLEVYNNVLELEIKSLKDRLAEKDAEIIRLTILLEDQARRKRFP